MARQSSRRRFVQTLPGAAAAASAAAPAAGAVAATGSGAYVNPRKVLLWESTRKEVRELLSEQKLKAVILPTGSTEQHNEHLAMIQDTASATLVAQQAALALYPQVMVATPVPVGISPHWMHRKGTLTLKKETFLAVVFETCESLKAHGVEKILILNGHGGNVRPLRDSIEGFRDKLGIDVQFNSYWDAYSREITERHMESKTAPGHAAEFETSFALAAFPERVHWEGVDYAKAKPHLAVKDERDAAQDERFAGEAKLASSVKGEAMINISVDFVVNRLREMMA